jgi:hypothetical protein
MATERPCSVCQHNSRLAIDQAVLNGKALRAIARDFGIGSGEPGTETFKPDHKKVERHRDRCMGEAYRAAREADLEASGLALVNRMKQLDEVVDEVLARERKGIVVYDSEGIAPLLDDDGQPLRRYNDRTILAAVQQARRNTEIRAKLSGAVPDGDPEALARQRDLLSDPKARRLMAELDALLNGGDQEVTH